MAEAMREQPEAGNLIQGCLLAVHAENSCEHGSFRCVVAWEVVHTGEKVCTKQIVIDRIESTHQRAQACLAKLETNTSKGVSVYRGKQYQCNRPGAPCGDAHQHDHDDNGR